MNSEYVPTPVEVVKHVDVVKERLNHVVVDRPYEVPLVKKYAAPVAVAHAPVAVAHAPVVHAPVAHAVENHHSLGYGARLGVKSY